LARFDRASRPRTPAEAADEDPLVGAKALGATWQGEAPAGYLRIERPLEPTVPRACVEILEEGFPGGDLLVLDTETTGLESGTGTLVFVVGLVRWSIEGQSLVQLFLPEPAGERAFLAAMCRELESAAGLVSYNGRGFDVPRLRSRMRLHRIDDDVLDLPHLDLLYPTRRLVRGWLPDARLKTVEEQLLSIVREGDLPGEFAPEVYRNLQLESRDTGIADVIRHNALDVENLPKLAGRLARALSGEEAGALPHRCLLEVARHRLDRGAPAEHLLRQVIEGPDPAARGEARAMLARLRRRAGDHAAAARVWSDHLADQPGDLLARVELAKLLEHHLRDLEGALALVAEARTLAGLRRSANPTLSEALDHRYRRLVRRIGSRG
jgi:uncharacterized protein YprB with RNaseH-like and TPR domain